MTWFALWAALQIGLSPSSGIVEYPLQPWSVNQTVYTQLEAEVRMLDGLLFAGGMVRTEVQQQNVNPSWVPELSSYGFKAGLRIGGFELGYLHVCQHPTLPYYSIYHPVIRWDGWWTELYVRVSGEVKLGR